MKHPRRILILPALALTALLALALPRLLPADVPVPGLSAKERTLLRIWVVSSPGGGQAWLNTVMKDWEKQHPGVMTYLRAVTPEEAARPDAVLPDLILYMPGDFTAPQEVFTELTGALTAREELLRAGRWQGAQYGLPLCWGAWVLAIDSALEPGTAATPVPTTLLGKPAAPPEPTASPGYPLAAASAAECPLLSPNGTALLSLLCSLQPQELPPLPQACASLAAADVYAAFQARRCATAVLTTGQVTALTSLVSSGRGFPFRIMTAPEIVTDQVWMASLTPDASPQAAAFLSFLTGKEAQQALSLQGLHTVRDDLHLYAGDFSAQVEQAAGNALTAINAYIPRQQVQQAAWQALQGTCSLSEALLPLV